MIFKDEKELKNYILSKCKVAVANTENKIYAIIKKTMNRIIKGNIIFIILMRLSVGQKT